MARSGGGRRGHRTGRRRADRPARWGRRWGLAALLVHSVLVQALAFVLRPTTSYRALELGVPEAWLGALAASFAVVPLALAVTTGRAADRFGERGVMLAGSLLLVVAAVLFVLVGGSVAGLVAASVVLGTGHLASVVAQQALVANRAGPGRLDTAFGYYTFATSVGQALGPALIAVGGGGAAIPDTSRIFAVAVAVAVPLAVLPLLLPGADRSLRPPDGEGPVRSRSLLRLPGLVRAIVVSAVVLTAVDVSLVYLPALGADRGLAAGVIGGLLALRAASSMVSRLFLGRLVRRLGRRALLLTGIAVSTVALALVPVPMPLWLLAVVVAVLGLGLGVGQPLTMSWVAEVTPMGLRGAAMSWRLTGNRLGQVVVPTGVGLVAAGLGASGVLWVTAAGLGLAGLAARRLPRGGEAVEEPVGAGGATAGRAARAG